MITYNEEWVHGTGVHCTSDTMRAGRSSRNLYAKNKEEVLMELQTLPDTLAVQLGAGAGAKGSITENS